MNWNWNRKIWNRKKTKYIYYMIPCDARIQKWWCNWPVILAIGNANEQQSEPLILRGIGRMMMQVIKSWTSYDTNMWTGSTGFLLLATNETSESTSAFPICHLVQVALATCKNVLCNFLQIKHYLFNEGFNFFFLFSFLCYFSSTSFLINLNF